MKANASRRSARSAIFIQLFDLGFGMSDVGCLGNETAIGNRQLHGIGSYLLKSDIRHPKSDIEMSLFLKIFLWFWLAIALLIGVFTFVSWTTQNEPFVR